MKDSISIAVDEFSTPVLVSGDKGDSIRSIEEKMNEHGVRHIPILDEGRPVGIISDRDIHLLCEIEKENKLIAIDIMVNEPFCVSLGTPLDEVAFQMSQKKIGSALVVDGESKLDSIFTSVDGLNALIEVIRGDID